jgi:pimeloyl-ACP methyl ester carboxylesterase
MKSRFSALLFSSILSCSGFLYSQEGLPPALPPYFRVHYEPSTQAGALVYGVSYTIWLPPGVKTLRGIIVHQHGCGEGACKAGQTAAFDLHWQALAKKHECALLGPSYEQPEKANCSLWCDPRNGSEKKFLQALTDLAAQTKHPELATVPWALWGHSGGATWVGTMLILHPDRIAAAWLRSGFPRLVPQPDSLLPAMDIPDAACAVPVMCNLGTKEGVTVKEGRFAKVWEGVEPFFHALRGKGGLIGVSVDPNSSHDCGNQRYLAMPWFDACLTARLPDKAEAKLKAMPTAGAMLAPLLGDAAQPAAKFTGDIKAAVWLPNAQVAKAWVEYVKVGNVSDSTSPPSPTHVKLAGNELSWQAEADLESGIASFIIERDGAEFALVPEKPVGVVGRQIFQKNGYSDTPTPPLMEMSFTDSNAKPGEKHTYRVITVNSVGLKSSAAAPSN